ncbi:MAG: hypothetical protein HY366_02945 [Candidatus Aenigmarchaeota archaeon]|nr:hypothetical protein [Candidatus Aenigmarchaeota archaeon]
MVLAFNIMFAQTGIPNVPTSWLAFFFVFAAVYGILTTTGKGGGIFKNNSVNTLMAVIFAFAAAGNRGFIIFFESNFVTLVWIFIGLFIVAFLLEAFGLRGFKARETAKNEPDKAIIFGGLVLLVLITFGFGVLGNIDVPVIGTKNALTILGLLFILQMFFYAYHGKPAGK